MQLSAFFSGHNLCCFAHCDRVCLHLELLLSTWVTCHLFSTCFQWYHRFYPQTTAMHGFRMDISINIYLALEMIKCKWLIYSYVFLLLVYRSNDAILKEPKYIVFESQLLKLFKICPECKVNCKVEKKVPKCFGSQISIVQECTLCAYSRTWYTQPKLESMWAGNIMLSAGILFAGGSPAVSLQMMNHMNLRCISYSTFMDHQRKYLQPAIVKQYQEQQSLIHRDIGGRAVTVGGDARCDSPGHSAKFGSYTLMDLDTTKVIDVQLVQVCYMEFIFLCCTCIK